MSRRLTLALALAALAPTLHRPAVAQAQHAQHAHGAGASAPATPVARRAPAGHAARVVVVRTLDYAFEVPTTLQAGPTAFRIVNAGRELHHVWLVRLEQGKTAPDYLAALQAAMQGKAPMPAWAIDVGGPNAPAPGVLADGIVDLAPGRYVMVCHIPSPDGTPHSAKGMVKTITVTGTPRGTAPAPDVEIALDDYDFRLSTPIVAGRRAIRFTNAADQPHEAFVAKLAPGVTVQQAAAWLEKMQGPPPLMPMGGATGLAKGRAMTVVADFTPGEYGLFCFVPDAKDGKPHVVHGMLKQITVAPAGAAAGTR